MPVEPETPAEPEVPVEPETPAEPETPVVPTIPSLPTKPEEPKKDATTIEDMKLPLVETPAVKVEVKGEESWNEVTTVIEEVVAELLTKTSENQNVSAPEVVEIVLPKEATVIPNQIFESIKEQNVVVEFKLENGITWSINGTSVTGDVSDLNLAVEIGAGEIPEEAITMVMAAEAIEVVTVSLAYSGEFGCEAVMNIPVGNENAGKYANLYYFNPETNEMEFVTSALIKEDGTADLTFTHASDYAILVEETDAAESENVKSDDTQLEEVEVPRTDGTTNVLPIIVVLVTLLAICAIAVIVLQKKKSTLK